MLLSGEQLQEISRKTGKKHKHFRVFQGVTGQEVHDRVGL